MICQEHPRGFRIAQHVRAMLPLEKTTTTNKYNKQLFDVQQKNPVKNPLFGLNSI
jgi:hypothetical protein